MVHLLCRWTSMYIYYLNAMDAIYKVRCLQCCSAPLLNAPFRPCRRRLRPVMEYKCLTTV